MLKKYTLLFTTLCLSLSTLTAPIYAQNEASSKYAPTAPTSSRAPIQNSTCKPCERPFRRLVKAMHTLKKANEMTEDEFKKAYTTIVKMPKETFKDAADPDLKAAELLHKGRMITDDQYKKICESLKSMPLPPKPSAAPNA